MKFLKKVLRKTRRFTDKIHNFSTFNTFLQKFSIVCGKSISAWPTFNSTIQKSGFYTLVLEKNCTIISFLHPCHTNTNIWLNRRRLYSFSNVFTTCASTISMCEWIKAKTGQLYSLISIKRMFQIYWESLVIGNPREMWYSVLISS